MFKFYSSNSNWDWTDSSLPDFNRSSPLEPKSWSPWNFLSCYSKEEMQGALIARIFRAIGRGVWKREGWGYGGRWLPLGPDVMFIWFRRCIWLSGCYQLCLPTQGRLSSSSSHRWSLNPRDPIQPLRAEWGKSQLLSLNAILQDLLGVRWAYFDTRPKPEASHR